MLQQVDITVLYKLNTAAMGLKNFPRFNLYQGKKNTWNVVLYLKPCHNFLLITHSYMFRKKWHF
jgi:hypothetical protein